MNQFIDFLTFLYKNLFSTYILKYSKNRINIHHPFFIFLLFLENIYYVILKS